MRWGCHHPSNIPPGAAKISQGWEFWVASCKDPYIWFNPSQPLPKLKETVASLPQRVHGGELMTCTWWSLLAEDGDDEKIILRIWWSHIWWSWQHLHGWHIQIMSSVILSDFHITHIYLLPVYCLLPSKSREVYNRPFYILKTPLQQRGYTL